MKLLVMLMLTAVIGAVIGTGRDVAAQEEKWESLRGLPGVYVLVEYMKPEAVRYGLQPSLIQTDVELHLRRAGIRVLTRNEMYVSSGNSYLYIQRHCQINIS